MNPFTRHTDSQGVTYIEHLLFAMGIALRLVNSAIVFALHAVFPFVSIERRLDLEATASFLLERNAWIENAGERQPGLTEPAGEKHRTGARLLHVCVRALLWVV